MARTADSYSPWSIDDCHESAAGPIHGPATSSAAPGRHEPNRAAVSAPSYVATTAHRPPESSRSGSLVSSSRSVATTSANRAQGSAGAGPLAGAMPVIMPSRPLRMRATRFVACHRCRLSWGPMRRASMRTWLSW